MKISKLIEELAYIMKVDGDLEVTCTHSAGQDGYSFREGRVNENFPDTWETTVENLFISKTKPDSFGEKHVRVWM